MTDSLPPFEPHPDSAEEDAFAEVYADPEFRRELEASRPAGATVSKVAVVPFYDLFPDALWDVFYDLPAGHWVLMATSDPKARRGWLVVWVAAAQKDPTGGDQ